MEEPEFHLRHWYCVGQVTDAARQIIQETGGDCFPFTLGPGIPSLILVLLPADLPDWIMFYDEGYSMEIEVGNGPRITLYSQNISPMLHQQSVDNLIIAAPAEWQAVWDALGSQPKGTDT